MPHVRIVLGGQWDCGRNNRRIMNKSMCCHQVTVTPAPNVFLLQGWSSRRNVHGWVVAPPAHLQAMIPRHELAQPSGLRNRTQVCLCSVPQSQAAVSLRSHESWRWSVSTVSRPHLHLNKEKLVAFSFLSLSCVTNHRTKLHTLGGV